MLVFNTLNVIKDFDVTKYKYEELIYSSSNTCKFAYYFEINRIWFILNFGATIYICCEKAYFREIIPCNSTVSWNKISQIKASGIDFVSIIFSDTDTKTILRNCFYISEFKINLISVQKLLKNYKIIFDEYCEIYTRDTGKLVSRD